MERCKKIVLIITLILTFLIMTTIMLYIYLLKPVSNKEKNIDITIESGMSTKQIGNLLDENNLIKNSSFFVIYLKINNINNLKAGKYSLSQDMSLKEIVTTIQEGNNYNENEISITFNEGINYRQLANIISTNTSNSYEDVLLVMQDIDYLNSLINDYWFITTDILNEDIYYPLEGYLYPETYNFKSRDVTVYEILKKLLDQMNTILTPYKDSLLNNDYSVHEILTLASIAEKEVNLVKDRSNVVSVFLNRLNKNMSLGSDVTTRYALKIDESRALYKSEYDTNNPYNTRGPNMLGKLPVGPIAAPSKDSILAAINPNKTDYLYFISNIKTNETFFFSKSRDFENKKNELSKVNQGY